MSVAAWLFFEVLAWGYMPGMNNRETDYRVYGFAHACPYAQRVARDPCPNFNFSLEPSFIL